MILSAVFGFIFGIAFGSFIHFYVWTSLALLIVSLLVFFYRFTLEGESRLHATIVAVFLFASLVGVMRISFSDLYKGSTLDAFSGKKILAEGLIVGEPDVREENTKLTVKLNKILYNEKEFSVSENVLVSVPIYPEYHYGDSVKLNITLKQPENFDSGEGRVFDYVGYLRARGIWYTASYARIELISSGNGNVIKSKLFEIKNAFQNSIANAISEPESSLLNGILLGAKQSLGKDLLLEFQRTGTSHIVVLSGYNIAIVASSVISFLSFLPKNLSMGFGVTSIILFTILSGSGASANRAAIMVIVALFAKRFNRDYKAGRALGFATLLMLAPNPLLLVYDPSFQLSVLATIGLVYVTPVVSYHLKFVTEKFGLREVVSATIGTQITTLPLLVYTTGIISIVSLPINILVLGTIPTTMFLGFITGLLGLVSLYLAFIPALFTYSLLWYQLFVIHLGSIVPFGYVNLPAFSFAILILVYMSIGFILFLENYRKTN